MDKTKLLRTIYNCLQDSLDRPGSILHSASSTLTKGDFYFLGYNPGGNHHDYLIKHEVDNLLNKTKHRYLDEQFEQAGHLFKMGQAPLQKNFQQLFNTINIDPRKVLCTNLIFFHSKRSDGVNYLQDATLCWPIHQALLELVKPKIIICNGNSNNSSAFSFLYKLLPHQQPLQTIKTIYSTAYIKAFTTQLNNQTVKVIGIPHLSRFYPSPYLSTIQSLVTF